MLQYNDALMTLATLNLEKLVIFYSKILGQEPTNLIPNVYAEFQVMRMKLGIFQYKASAKGEFECYVPGKMSLCLEVMDLESAIACFTDCGYPPPGSMIIASHGREIYAYDPDGNRIILHQSSI